MSTAPIIPAKTWYQKMEEVIAALLPLANTVVDIADPAIAGAADRLSKEMQAALNSLSKAQSMVATQDAFEAARTKPLW